MGQKWYLSSWTSRGSTVLMHALDGSTEIAALAVHAGVEAVKLSGRVSACSNASSTGAMEEERKVGWVMDFT